MTNIAIIHHSGYGHTKRMAEFVQTGVSKTGAEAHFLTIDEHGDLPETGWEILLKADGVLFGSPTYMGGASWQLKNSPMQAASRGLARRGKINSLAGLPIPLHSTAINSIPSPISLRSPCSIAWFGLVPA